MDRNIFSHILAKWFVNQQTHHNKPASKEVHVSQVVTQTFQDLRNEENETEDHWVYKRMYEPCLYRS